MVRNKKIKPIQIIVLLIALALYACMGLIVYFFLKPGALVGINDSKLGICYDMMYDLKKENEKVQLFDIQMEDKKMTAQFKYISQMVSEKEDWLAFGNEIRSFISDYLTAHPEHQLMTEHWELELICPGVIYSNCFDGTNYGASFVTASYEKDTDLYTAAGFLKNAASLGDITNIVIEDATAALDAGTDLTQLAGMSSVKTITLKLAAVDPLVQEKIKNMGIIIFQK